MKINSAIVKPALLIATAFTLFLLPGLRLPYLDQKAENYFSGVITKAGFAYGVCRAVNASVSVIKESQIQIEPGGLGVALAAGQALDPLDDLTERASDLLITVIVSLGIQKVAYELSLAFAPALLAIFALALVIISFLKGEKAKAINEIIRKIIILIAAARLCLPVSAIVSSLLDEHYFAPKIIKVREALAMNSPEMERLKALPLPEINGFLGTVRNGFCIVGEKASDLGAALKAMLRNMDSMISNLLKLSYLYMAIFIIQVILLPLGAFWFMVRITNTLSGAKELSRNKLDRFREISRTDIGLCRRGAYLKVCNGPVNPKAFGRNAKM